MFGHFCERHGDGSSGFAPDPPTPFVWSLHSPSTCPPRPRVSCIRAASSPAAPLKVAYIDSTIAIILKPQGISVQGGDKSLLKSDLLLAVTYSNQWSAGWKDEGDYSSGVIGKTTKTPPPSPSSSSPSSFPLPRHDALGKARPSHRLDSATGGLLLCSRTKKASSLLPQLFKSEDKTILQKRYRAVVFGSLEHDAGEVDFPVDKKASLTRYRVVSRTKCSDKMCHRLGVDNFVTTVDLWPITGRQHQLRKHMRHLGHPIFGDRRYANYGKGTTFEGFHSLMCLWALEIDFVHPFTADRVKVTIDEPDYYAKLRSHYNELAGAESSSKQGCPMAASKK